MFGLSDFHLFETTILLLWVSFCVALFSYFYYKSKTLKILTFANLAVWAVAAYLGSLYMTAPFP